MKKSLICVALLSIMLAVSLAGCGGETTSTGIPSAPTGVTTSAGDGKVTIGQDAAAGVTSYNIYWSTTTGVTKTSGTKITGATNPYSHTGRTNGTQYYYIVTAVNSSGESEASAQVSATPAAGSSNLIGRIAFVSDRDGSREIYVMNTDGSNQQRISTHTGAGWTDNEDNPIWSPNAGRITLTSWRDGINELYIVNPDGTGEAALMSSVTTTIWSDNPSWSPSGDRIAFESNRTGDPNIFVMNADGSNQTRLTYGKNPYSNNYLSFTYPDWSPDGSKILCETHWFVSGNGVADDAGGIYVFSVSDGSYVRLTHDADDHIAVWSPDSSKIAFYRKANNNSNADIYIMNSNGSGLTKLTQGINPVWSPDGSKIAFLSEKDGNGLKLSVIRSDGTGEINLMGTFNNMGVAWTPSWSPDGKMLVFGYGGHAYLINSDGSGLKKITTGTPQILSGIKWSPK